MNINNVTWAQLKSFVNARGLSIQWIDFITHYTLLAVENNYELSYLMPKSGSPSVEQIDFETNYKTIGNQQLKQRTLVVDGIDIATNVLPTTSAKLRYDDMVNVARGSAIVAGSSWYTIYAYAGSGSLFGMSFGMTTANSNWRIRLNVDGEEIFGTNGILTDDLSNTGIANSQAGNFPYFGLNMVIDAANFKFSAPADCPIAYESSVQVQIQRVITNKVYNGGIIILSKDT